MAETRTRPGRSNSLQRMLEAEKRCMLERLQGLPVPTPPYMASTTSLASTSSRKPSPSRLPIQARPPAIMPAKKAKSSPPNTRNNPTAPQLPPLVIPTLPTSIMPKMDQGRANPRPAIIQSPNMTEKEKRNPKVVAFEIADDQEDKRSLCSSPSWDAYDRRKKAKKEEKKEERKEKERGRGKERVPEPAEPQEKKRRLSKLPPQSSSHALKVVSHMVATQHKQQKQTPASAPVLPTPVKVETPAPRSRSRSSSFTSLIKSPFTSRRSSIDQTVERPDTAFIGGIKLEYQKHVAYQKAIEAQAKSGDGDGHPALRSFRSRQTWPNPASPAVPGQRTRAESQPSKMEPTTSSSDAAKQPPKVAETTKSYPPAPPRRSSKRNSLLSLSGSAPYLPTSSEGSSAGSMSSDTPRNEYLNSWGDSRYSRPSSIQLTPKCSPKLSPRHVNSSDDSCSEKFHSPAQSGTPDTSRPPSEKGLTPLFSDFDKGFMLDDQVKSDQRSENWPLKASPQLSTNVTKDEDQFVMAPEKPEDAEMDQIQAAAEKVLADYTQIPRGRPSVDRRTRSESNIVPGETLPLRLKEKSKPREFALGIKAPAVEAVEAPSPKEIRFSIDPRAESSLTPAVYLEAARKAVPTSLATLQSSQTSPVLSSMDNHQPIQKLRNPSPSAPYNSHTNTTKAFDSTPKAKVFVECCGCKYYHDMPSGLYEAMTNPEKVLKTREKLAFAASVSMTVKCPWCKHEMSTRCCAGFAAMVYVKERLH